MKKIPNHMVTELQRLVPLIIDNVSETKKYHGSECYQNNEEDY